MNALAATARTRPDRAFVVTWLPTISIMLVSTISYLDRNKLALTAPSILRDTGLTAEQYGFVISGFSIAYALCNPVWGRILDRLGVRWSLLAAVSVWSLACASHALAGGFFGFLAARTALGGGEEETIPGVVRTAAQTLPVHARMRGIGIGLGGSSIGAILTPILITPLTATLGWRAGFWFTGAVGVLWLALWARPSRRRDLALQPVAVQSGAAPRWNDPRMWAFLAAYSLGISALAFVLYSAPLYLSAAFHKTRVEIGRVLWIPPLGSEAGVLFWGWMSDRVVRSGAPRRALGRQFVSVTALIVPLAVVPHAGSYFGPLALLFAACSQSPGPRSAPSPTQRASMRPAIRG